MNNHEFVAAIHSSMYRQCRTRGYATPVDVRLSFIMSTIRACARQHQLKPSFCYYKQWGVKKKNGQGRRLVIPLRFSKSGAPEIEKSYATHYLDSARIDELKQQKE